MEPVLLGAVGGPVWATDRAGTSSAVVVGDAVYLVDCGTGCGQQFRRAGLDLAALRGLFVTHLHSDHISDYFNLQLYGWYQNLEHARRPVHAYGRWNEAATTFSGRLVVGSDLDRIRVPAHRG